MAFFDIDYSIVSKGTERDGKSKGYMSVTKIYQESRYLVPIHHNSLAIRDLNHSLKCYSYHIKNIAVSRFQLISALPFSRISMERGKRILICGLGCVGLSAIIELLRTGRNNIGVFSKKENNFLEQIRGNLNCSIYFSPSLDDIVEYDYIVDATGDGLLLKKLVEQASNFSKIIVLGTPRKNSLIDSLVIHRKNISLFGAHELGYTADYRNATFKTLLESNDGRFEGCDAQFLFNFHEYSESKLEEILSSKASRMFDIFTYSKS